MGTWYSKGFDEAEVQAAASQVNWTREFFLKSGEDAAGVRILDEDSFNIKAHFVKGKGWYTCMGEGCPLCEDAAKGGICGKAQNQFVFNVFDPREYVDKKGESHKDQIKIWRVGITLLRILNKKRSKFGPYPTLVFNISKMGSGQSTAWDIDAEKSDKKFTFPEGQELYDLEEALAPKSRGELLAVLSGTTFTENEDDDDNDEEISWKKA